MGQGFGGLLRPGPPPLATKKVTICGHKQNDSKPAVLGSPQPVHVHAGRVGDATTNMTSTEPCGCNIADVIQCYSMPFNGICSPGQHCISRCSYHHLTRYYHCHHRCHCHYAPTCGPLWQKGTKGLATTGDTHSVRTLAATRDLW